MKVGETVKLKNLEGTQQYSGKVSRINAAINQGSQTVSVFIDVESDKVKEGMYLEALIEAQQEEDAIEIARRLVNDQKEIFVVKDSVLDLLQVDPVYFTDKTAIIKGIKNGDRYFGAPGAGGHILVC